MDENTAIPFRSGPPWSFPGPETRSRGSVHACIHCFHREVSMNYAQLGATGIEVSELCYGTLTLGPLQANVSPEEGAKAIIAGLDRGITFIDTAHTYGTYAHVRLALQHRPEAVIASKGMAADRAGMRSMVESCLREIGRDVIDVFLLHFVNSADDLRAREGALETLVRCREEGLVRAVGLSSHSPHGVEAALIHDDIQVVLPLLNRKGLGIIRGSLHDMLNATRKVRATGRGLYNMKPLGGGHLIGDITGAVHWVRDTGLFDSISVGLLNQSEAELMADLFENVAGAETRAYAEGKARAGRKRLLIHDFCQRCGACVDTCAQGALSLGETTAQVNPEKCILCGYCAVSCPAFAIRVV